MNNFLKTSDFPTDRLSAFIDSAIDLKQGKNAEKPLAGKSFQKRKFWYMRLVRWYS